MPRYIGYSTVGTNKKATLVDRDLVIRDLINAFNIKEGELPGRPGVGCGVWNYLFEPQTESAIEDMRALVLKTCALDPRVQVQSAELFPQENGVLIELEVLVDTDVDPVDLALFFDSQSRVASLV